MNISPCWCQLPGVHPREDGALHAPADHAHQGVSPVLGHHQRPAVIPDTRVLAADTSGRAAVTAEVRPDQQ